MKKNRRTFIEIFDGERYHDPEAKVNYCMHVEDELVWMVEKHHFDEMFPPLQPITEKEIEDLWKEHSHSAYDKTGMPDNWMFKEHFKAAITALQGKEQRGEEWISVEDRLPEVSGYYWITFGGTYVRKIFYTEAVKVWGVGEQVYPAYWKPYVEVITPPPKKQGDKGKEGA